MLEAIPWKDILLPEHPWEMIIRGTLSYFGLLLILRVILKRQAGSLASSDILVTLLISDAIQNAMAGEYKSVPDGLLLVATLMAWDFFIDWLIYYWPPLMSLLNPAPLPLVSQGRLLRKNMRKELITVAELKEKMREQNIDDIRRVKSAFLESDGEISFIKVDRKT